jgi:hypothetical protein
MRMAEDGVWSKPVSCPNRERIREDLGNESEEMRKANRQPISARAFAASDQGISRG